MNEHINNQDIIIMNEVHFLIITYVCKAYF